MSFGFDASQYAVDPSTLPAVQPGPATPQTMAQPSSPPTGGTTLPQPGLLDILQGMVFKGQSPADAAMAVRQRDYQVRTMQRTADILPTLPAPLQAAAMMGGPKVWEEIAKNYGPQTRSAGQQTDYMGGAGHGGYTASTGTNSVDDKSGVPILAGPDGSFRTLGPSLGGDFSAKDGVVASGRTGDLVNRYSLPQLKPVTSSLEDFLPGIGVGALKGPTPAPRAASPNSPISAKPTAAVLLNSQGALDPAAFVKSFIIPHEAGWNARDMNGSPTNFGINQAANPGVDVVKLTPETATDIYTGKYYPASGSATLSPALAAVNFDTSVINPRMASHFLAQSGGDPSKYMDLRDQWMAGMVARNPAAQRYAQAWANRNADLRQVAATLGGASPGANATPVRQPGSGGSGASIRTLAGASMPTVLDPNDPTNADHYKPFAPGTVLQRAADGTTSIVQPPEFSPSERSKMRQQFLESEGYKGNVAASSALQALTQNIGKMTGPSAYSILDTFARTINPGAVARQGTLSAIEDSLGLPAHLVGGLQNIVGQGKIPLHTQQQILDAVTPFAQSHWDQAKQFYDANTALAQSKHLDPNEVTAPIGTRPVHMIATLGGALSEADVVAQAKAAIARGANPMAVKQRLQSMGINSGLLQ